MRIQGVILTIVIGSIAIACKENRSKEIELPFYNEATFTPEWINAEDEKYKSIHAIPDFEFVNQNGDTISNNTFQDKIYVTNFFFTLCPNVCPRMTDNLTIVQKAFNKDDRVKILSHTVMPWADSVARLAEYAALHEINSDQWHLVTGDQKDIYKIARESYFADEGFGKTVTSDEDFLHTENIILIDQKRRIRGIYNGTIRLDMKRMIDDIYTLL
ncbi:SCO family protein [Reichenbachiella sp. MALMAid0571]|uniref:SCO family protein n=1 Tax=Reichenbachiella sp. MALMAid0571 TaxID=3143939 RepID=UPI0032DE2C68